MVLEDSAVEVSKPSDLNAFSSIPTNFPLITNVTPPAPTNVIEGEEENETGPENSNILVIHVGSESVKAGLADAVFPVEVPTVIAFKSTNSSNSSGASGGGLSERQKSALVEMANEIKPRMGKKVSAAKAQVAAFNANAPIRVHEVDDDDDDDEKMEIAFSSDYIVGNDALAALKKSDYEGLEEAAREKAIDNLQIIIEHVLFDKTKGLSLSRSELKTTSLVLVIPDAFDRNDLEATISLFLCKLGFHRCLPIQESVTAAFAAGLSTAAVIDIGATSVSVSCVEEGFCIPASRILLPFGGTDITNLLVNLLRQSRVPESCLLRTDELIKLCSLDPDIAISISTLEISTPEGIVQFKTFDEPWLAAMAICHPLAFSESESQRLFAKRERIIQFGECDRSDYLSMWNENAIYPPSIYEGKGKSSEVKSSEGEENSEVKSSEDKSIKDKDKSIEDKSIEDKAIKDKAIEKYACKVDGCGVELPLRELVDHFKSSHILAEDYVVMWNEQPVKSKSSHGLLTKLTVLATTEKSKENNETSSPADSFMNIPLDEAIRASIEAVNITSTITLAHRPDTPPLLPDNSFWTERAKRFWQSVIITGGASEIPGLALYLQDKLNDSIASGGSEWIVRAKGIEPRWLSWKGASVIAKGISGDDLWITNKQWQNAGLKSLASRSLFHLQA